MDLLQALHDGVTVLPNRIQTSLSATQVREAEAAFQYLQEHFPDKSLSWLTNEFSRHYQPDLEFKPLSEAIDEYIGELKARGTKKKYYENIQIRLAYAKGWFPKKYVSDVEGKALAKRIKGLAEENELGATTLKHYAAAFTGFFRWAAHADRCYLSRSRANPGASILVPLGSQQAGKRREILTVEQARTVMAFAESYQDGKMVNAAAMALFAGIRPDAKGEIVRVAEEISAAGELSDIVDLANNVIHITEYVGKEGARETDIQPALKAYLTVYPLDKFPIVKSDATSPEAYFQRHWTAFKRELTAATGVRIPHDGLRHSFCSYLAMQLGSAHDVAMQAGNSEAILRKHYFRRVSKEQSEAFWAIRPVQQKHSK